MTSDISITLYVIIQAEGNMKLIVGLGNPGKKYRLNRHNMGFRVLDEVAEQLKIDIDQEDFKSLMIKTRIYDEEVILAKPKTFMNLSGEAVVALMNFYKIPLEDIVIVYDDMDIPCGEIRLRETGSGGSHNGINNIILLAGSKDIKKIRVGIGRPEFMDQVDYVLSDPRDEEKALVDEGVKKAAEAVLYYVKHDFGKAMNIYNRNNEKPVK